MSDPIDCPKCDVGRLTRVSLQLHARAKDGKARLELMDLDQCGACNGIWFDRGELEKYLGAKLTVLDSPEIGKSLHEKMDRKPGTCPRCDEVMRHAPAPKDKSVTADCCRRCGGIWLDSRELDRLEKANQGVISRFSQLLEHALPDSWWDDWKARGR